MKPLRILVACEESGTLRSILREYGHDAWSCDLLPARDESEFHVQGDVLPLLKQNWDAVVAFPPCTHLAVSGARWFAEKRKSGDQQQAVWFFMQFAILNHVPHVAIENPVGIMNTMYRKPDQIVQPWQYGHGETKATCLWLKGLPKLTPTNVVAGREQRVWKMSPSPDRARERSVTFQGIARAMADQWFGKAVPMPEI